MSKHPHVVATEPNGHRDDGVERAAPRATITVPVAPRLRRLWRIFGPYLIAVAYLALGYLHYAPGTAYSLSAAAYRSWSFPAFRYSDIIWLYLRDGLQGRPIPYVDYALEYPPLTGLISYALSYAPDLPSYFRLAYLLLAASALLTIWALKRIPGANPWLFALAPALFFYTGHQWDLAAVGVAAVGVLLTARGRERWGMAALAAGVSLKLFPLAFVAALLLDRLVHRRWRSLFQLGAIAAAVTIVCNLPFALANVDRWLFFYTWNRDRLADSGVWVLFRGAPTGLWTDASLLAALAGGAVLTGVALWRRGPIFVPFGATALLWWLAVNKTFTTHLILWVFLALALLRAPWPLWGAAVAIDLVGFQLGNFLNLYNVGDYHFAPLIRKAVENVYDPLQIARSVVLFAAVGWGGAVLWRRAWPTAPPTIALDAPLQISWPGWLRSWAGQRASISPTPIGIPRAATRRERRLVGAAVTLLFATATVVMTWPYVLDLSDATVVGFDPLLQIWLSRWVQHALTTDPRHLYDANIFYPFQQTLAYTDANIPGALIAAPIDLLTRNPILTNSLLVLATFVFAAAGVYAIVVRLTGNRAAGILCGLAYAFLPYRYVHLWHLNWLESAWLPWIVLALLATIERPTWRRGALLGLLSAILILTSFYFAIQIAFLGLALTFAALVARPALRSLALYRALGLAALVIALICVPLDLPYLAVQQEQGLERTLAEAEQYKATPASYLAVAPWQAVAPLDRLLGVHPGVNQSLTTVGQTPHADGHMHPEIVIEDALFPGGIALVGALVGLCCWRRDRWLLVALTFVAVT
ncbi:MAG TPA: glycosyltransferase 87 family protein, partial [Thermomicrobiales bacterium]|nr:glycosyltransferase 87 family protein [Thermomicrobiales bacterium]